MPNDDGGIDERAFLFHCEVVRDVRTIKWESGVNNQRFALACSTNRERS
jgi:hypothetical protein